MRSHRIQKSGIRKRGELGGVKIEDSMRYSIFKYSDVTPVDTTDYKPLQAYIQPKGNVAVSSVTKIGVSDFSEDLITIRDKVVAMRNLDEEIAKCGERNKIQLSDIQDDIQNQKQEIAEMESDLLHLLDSAEDQFR